MNPDPFQDPGHVSPNVNPRDSPLKQQRRMGSPSRRELSILEGENSRLEQEAARCLFIYLPGWASPGRARGGDIAEVLQRHFLLLGKPGTLKFFLFGKLWGRGTAWVSPGPNLLQS